jgi:hypothetical protein
LFEELERDALQPLPSTPYELATWKSAKVNLDYHVELDTRYYSVPYQLVHEPVEVRATAQVVEILHRNRRVSSHVREYGRRRFITKPEHMPAAHRAHLEWTPSKLVAWGASVGPPVRYRRGECRADLLVARVLGYRLDDGATGSEPGVGFGLSKGCIEETFTVTRAASVHGDVNWTRQPLHTVDSALRRLALAIALPFTP